MKRRPACLLLLLLSQLVKRVTRPGERGWPRVGLGPLHPAAHLPAKDSFCHRPGVAPGWATWVPVALGATIGLRGVLQELELQDMQGDWGITQVREGRDLWIHAQLRTYC